MLEALRSLIDEMAVALQPLGAAANDDAVFIAILSELGWTVQSVPQPLTALSTACGDIVTIMAADPATISADQTLAAIKKVIDAIGAIATASDASFPVTVDVATFKSTIGRDLLDFLIATHLRSNHATIAQVLRLAGILRMTPAAASGLRQPYLQMQIQWSQIPTLITNPLSGFRDAFAWVSASPDLTAAIGVMGDLIEQAGLAFSYRDLLPDLAAFVNAGATTPGLSVAAIDLALDDTLDAPGDPEAGLKLALRPPTAARGPALALLPYANVALNTDIPIGDNTTLSLQSDADLSKGFAITLAPGSGASLDAGFLNGGTAAKPAQVSASLTRTAPADDPADPVFGSADGSSLSIQSTRIAGGASLSTSGALDLFAQLDVTNAKIVIKPEADTDSFLGELIGDDGLSAQFSFGVRLSSQSGFHFTGSADLEASFPVEAKLAFVGLRGITIGVAPGPQRVDLRLGADITASIGPVSVTIDGVGVTIGAAFSDPAAGNLGPLDVSFGALAPSGVGLSIDTGGVVTGSGFLFHDAAHSTYVGALQVTLHETVTLTALGLIATQLPDGSRGYSLLVFITAQDFKPIPLGLGFTLQAIGGLVAINRTFDEQVIRDGLKNDTLKTLLFPQDPVTNARAIVSSLESAFPARRGSYLLGLMARIGWGTPTVLQFDLALILEFGARERLIALGRLTATLPTPSKAMLRLTLDALGVLDFDAGTIALDATLVDSKLAGVFAITGAGALRAGWGGAGPGKSFLLSVGGFNPRFVPPAGVPALPRVAIALSAGSNPQLTCEAYFALTSNTVQFGARAQLVASAAGFSLTGDIGFDVLFDSPTHFIADFQASVQLKAGSTNLFKVSVNGTLEGLLPLRFSGRARFEILWCHITVNVQATLRDGASPAVAAVDAMPLLVAALSNVANWTVTRPTGTTQGVALRNVALSGASTAGTAAAPASSGSSGVLLLDPLGTLTVLQNVVPFGTTRAVDLVQGAPIQGARQFTLTGNLGGSVSTTPPAGSHGLTVNPALGDFAPAQVFVLTEDQKLASPSFETWQAGVTLGSNLATIVDSQAVPAPVTYDAYVLDSLPGASVVLPAPTTYVLPAAQLAAHAPSGAAAKAPSRRAGRARFRVDAPPQVALTAPAFSVVSTTTGATVTPPTVPGSSNTPAAGTTWSEQQAIAAQLTRAGQSVALTAAA